jgi:hypothetical protein
MTTSISDRLVRENKINTIKLPRAIMALNADGTINGKITDVVQIKIKIQDHEEILELAVSNIGKKDVFIGHDWLMHHNPEMDWKNNQIKFSRCPGECYEESNVNEPEDKIDQFDSTTDKILAIVIDQPEYI